MAGCPAKICPEESLERSAEMEQAWAELAAAYPLPDPPLDPPNREDGSWRGPSGHWLDRSQNSEVADHHRRAREYGDQVICPALRAIEAQDDKRCLVGLEYWIKSLDRLREKVAGHLRLPGEPVSRAIDRVHDTIRFTFIYCRLRYVRGVMDDLRRLEEAGFERLTISNSWSNEEYKGVNASWWMTELGFIFEVQFHTVESFQAKMLTHPAYERLRVARVSDGLPGESERRALRKYQRRVSSLISVPESADKIPAQEVTAGD